MAALASSTRSVLLSSSQNVPSDLTTSSACSALRTRSRALLARVLAGKPRWILADEPLAALDLAHQAALLRTFRALAGEGVGIVLVLHDLARAMNGADRAIVLERGLIVADGVPAHALCAEQLAQTWGVTARWIGEPGQQALSLPT